jgi:2'-5' RNA ligase
MRCFIGIGLPDIVRERLVDAVQEFGREKAPVSWTAPENMHITLKFLGETVRDRITDVENGLAEAAADFQAFSMEAAGGGIFPGARDPKVLWAGAGESLELAGKLHQTVNNAMMSAGFPAESRPFHPHITIGRVKRTLPAGWGDRFLRHFAGRAFGIVPVSSIILFESRLSRGGAIYSVIREFPLMGVSRRGKS